MSDLGFSGFFFDTEKVLKMVAAKERQWLGKAGGYVRKTAQNSIKYGSMPRQVSAPGQTPIAHKFGSFMRVKKLKGKMPEKQASSPLKELLFYGYDTQTKSVVVGPAVFRRARVPGLAPKLLEKGGSGTFQDAAGNVKTGTWKPRPFMAPALKKAAPRFPDIFQAG